MGPEEVALIKTQRRSNNGIFVHLPHILQDQVLFINGCLTYIDHVIAILKGFFKPLAVKGNALDIGLRIVIAFNSQHIMVKGRIRGKLRCIFRQNFGSKSIGLRLDGCR